MLFYGYHGVFHEENRLGQRFIVDLELSLSLYKAGKHDALEYTVNYAEVYELIKDIVERKTFKLIETLADNIAISLLKNYSILQEVSVRVTKPTPPINIHFVGVSVEIKRRRPVISYIGVGSNLGDRESYLRQAVRLLAEHPQIDINKCSSIYITEPIGCQ
jgi:dihydroneopterin aldolase